MAFSVYQTFRSLVAAARAESYFDSDFYREFYPDVVSGGFDPLEHYVEFGAAEGRHPNAVKMFWSKCLRGPDTIRRAAGTFVVDPEFYLVRYPDVAAAGADPITHYISYGWWERRLPNGKLVPLVQAVRIALLVIVSFLRSIVFRIFPSLLKATAPWSESARDELFRNSKYGSVFLTSLAVRSWKSRNRSEGGGVVGGIFPVVHVERHVVKWLTLKWLGPVETCECQEPAVLDRVRPLLVHRIPSPNIWLASLNNATVAGAFQVMVGRTFVQYEPAADSRHELVAGQWQYVSQVTDAPDKVLVFIPYEKEDWIEEGILISGRCSPNYFHFLIEYISKVYVCDLVPELARVPLIVDSGMYAQQREALQLLFPGRRIFEMDRNARLNVGKLHIPSIPTYLPDTIKEPLWLCAALRREPIDYLRRKVLAHFGIAPNRRATKTGRKIYLSRRSGRTITNREQVEIAMSSLGYEIVDSGTLSFEAQVRMFAAADIIVGGLGAAFSNVIFCAPGTRVLGICSPVAVNFPMFASLSEFAHCHYISMGGIQDGYMPGDEEMPEFDNFHGSFSVDVDRLVRNVSQFEVAELH